MVICCLKVVLSLKNNYWSAWEGGWAYLFSYTSEKERKEGPKWEGMSKKLKEMKESTFKSDAFF